MSPTSYQAAPPHTVTISDETGSVRPAQAAESCRLLFSDSRSENYHRLYGGPSNGEVALEWEWTSTSPVPDCSGLSTTLSNCKSQSVAPVIGSLGTVRR